jgi:hypothetical protein
MCARALLRDFLHIAMELATAIEPNASVKAWTSTSPPNSATVRANGEAWESSRPPAAASRFLMASFMLRNTCSSTALYAFS